MKNVLVLSYHFPPFFQRGAIGGIQRTLKFVRYLPEFGWQPTVVTSKPRPGDAHDPQQGAEVPADVDVHSCYSLEVGRLPIRVQELIERSVLDRLCHFFQVPDAQNGWLPFALGSAEAIIHEKPIDAIYSTSPPATAHILAYILKRKHNVPWVADFRDPWTQDPRFVFRTPSVYRGVAGYLERKVLDAADRVIMVSLKSWLSYYLNSGQVLDNGKVITITNGFDEEDFVGISHQPSADRFTIVYAGFMPPDREWLHFWAALKRTIDSGCLTGCKVQVLLLGTVDETCVKGLASKFGLQDKLRIGGFVLRRVCLEYLHQADVLLLSPRGVRYAVSGKTFESLRTRRPILALAGKGDALRDFIVDSGAGIVVPPDDERAIADALLTLYTNKLAGVQPYVASDAFIAQYERRALTRQLADVLNEVSSSG